jgi:CHAT domain-containing protein
MTNSVRFRCYFWPCGPCFVQACLISRRFVSGHLHDLDDVVALFQNFMLSTTRFDPRHALVVQSLARARFERYMLSGQREDLERSILGFTEAVFLPLPWDTRPPFLNLVQTFYYLTLAIFFCAKEFQDPANVTFCISYLRYLRGQWHEVPIDIPLFVTATLVRALAVKVELNLGDVDSGIEEMAVLCNELLDSNISTQSLTQPIVAFARTVDDRLCGTLGGRILSGQVIHCLRKATMHLPYVHDISIALARSLFIRRDTLQGSNDDYAEGMGALDKLISVRAAGDGLPSPYRKVALKLATKFATAQFFEHGRPDLLEQAIYHIRGLLDETSFEDPHRAIIIGQLSFLQGKRYPPVTPDFQTVQSSTSQSNKLPSFHDLTASLSVLNSAEPIPTAICMQHLQRLNELHLEDFTDIADIKDGIKYCRQLLSWCPDSQLAPLARLTLFSLFFRAFASTNEIKYLNEGISAAREDINPAHRLIPRFHPYLILISFLSVRLRLLRLREDLDELMQLFSVVSHSEHVAFLNYIPILCQWALIAHEFAHSSTPTAYDRAMSSMKDSLTSSPTLEVQHSRLVARGDISKTLPLDYASYQIHTGQLEQAIETLERGRVLLWSEIRSLRTSINQIRLADPHLAEEFAAVSSDLEMLTFNHIDGGESDEGNEGVDSFGHLVMRQRELLAHREKLISEVRSLPGLDAFLKLPSFETLHSAASHGPVIIINHSRWRSDIVILLHNAPPSLIPTSDDFYVRATKLQDQLYLERRKNGLDSYTYEDALCSVLQQLYELVGQPVIRRLNELNVPEQSRVWWCPTSVFCSLPLHAMGPIPSDSGPTRYFLDLYIPSYTPSLSALTESRKASPQATGKPSILLVSQPSRMEMNPYEVAEMRAVQRVDTQVTTLVSAKATPTAVLAGLRDHPFAHISCHASLEPGKPFEASFKLHKGEHLSLLDIVRSQLPNAEFAFLSACHTAELTEESIADEVLHLAAAMQFCGFRSVVGAMWGVGVIDGRDLARYFYKSLFSDETPGVRYHERTAAALRDAVVRLRGQETVKTLERWVNFVHYGA